VVAEELGHRVSGHTAHLVGLGLQPHESGFVLILGKDDCTVVCLARTVLEVGELLAEELVEGPVALLACGAAIVSVPTSGATLDAGVIA
jgi:hypothetical protein